MGIDVLATGLPGRLIERQPVQEERARDLMEAGLEKRLAAAGSAAEGRARRSTA
jgi:hypothetical protein